MFISERVDLRLLDDISDATRALVEVADVDPDDILLIGARCRDVLHSGLGHATTTRATRDLDLGIAVADGEGYERLATHFRRIGSNGVGYRIADLPVDVVPFGPRIEDPRGVARPTSRRDGIAVFGFQQVFERALPLFLPSGHAIRLPRPEGYSLLKLRAWLDRRTTGDADDIALAIHWYTESTSVRERLYDDLAVLETHDFNELVASAHILGSDMRQQLSAQDATALVSLVERRGLHDLTSRLIGLPHDRGLRREVVNAFAAGLQAADDD